MAGLSLYAMYGEQPLLTIADTAEQAIDQADALVIVTTWDEFKNPDFDLLKTIMTRFVIFDGRNIYDPKTMAEKGFRYFAIGRGETI
jgi:UDPglucose 6-dehydrogenase